MLQEILVFLAFSGAVFMLGRTFYRAFRPAKREGAACGCAGSSTCSAQKKATYSVK